MAKFLIVDDSTTSRKMLREIIEQELGHIVIGEASDGEKGVKMFDALHPDVVTMDITMPVMNGIEALKKIKELNPHAKVIMITASGQSKMITKAVDLGADEFIAKPYEHGNIIAILKKLAL